MSNCTFCQKIKVLTADAYFGGENMVWGREVEMDGTLSNNNKKNKDYNTLEKKMLEIFFLWKKFSLKKRDEKSQKEPITTQNRYPQKKKPNPVWY